MVVFMKDDLISRSALLEQVRFSLPIDSERRRVIADCVDITRRLITEAPSVDAVEVVQCIDCRYLKTCNRTIELIPRQAQIGYLRCVVHSCEYGERRADDATD